MTGVEWRGTDLHWQIHHFTFRQLKPFIVHGETGKVEIVSLMILVSSLHVYTLGLMLSWLIQGSSFNNSHASLQKLAQESVPNPGKTDMYTSRRPRNAFGICRGQRDSPSTSSFSYHPPLMNAPYPSVVTLIIRGWSIWRRSTKRLTVTLSYYSILIIIIIQRVKKFSAFIEPESLSHTSKPPITGHNPVPNFSTHLSKIRFSIILRYISDPQIVYSTGTFKAQLHRCSLYPSSVVGYLSRPLRASRLTASKLLSNKH
jgi:hypothetical protein